MFYICFNSKRIIFIHAYIFPKIIIIIKRIQIYVYV